MALPWFRMYAEFAGDPVVQSLSFDDQRHFIVIMCLKCSGLLDRDISPASRREQIIARGIGLDGASASEAKKRLMDVSLIDKNWQPIAWERRQFVSDVSSDRVRKHRNNKETGNGFETVENRYRNGDLCSVSVSESSDIKSVPGLNLQAWDRWVAYRVEIRKPLKPVSIETAKKALAKFGNDQMAVVEQSIANGWQGLFELKGKKNQPQHVSPSVTPPSPPKLPNVSPEQALKNQEKFVSLVKPMLVNPPRKGASHA